MFIRKKKYPSGNIGVIVAEKVNGMMHELHTVGIATDNDGIEPLVAQGREWIDKENARRHPRLDLFGEERQASEREYLETERVLSNISNVFLNGADLLLDHVFDSVGFNKIEDAVFRQLVKARHRHNHHHYFHLVSSFLYHYLLLMGLNQYCSTILIPFLP